MLPAIQRFCDWLQGTCFSVGLQTRTWVVPALQSVHIVAIAALIGASLAYSLHVLGFSARDQPTPSVAARHLPIVWGALPVLLVSGALLVAAEPARSLLNPVFAIKMGLLLIASALTLYPQLSARRSPAFWERKPLLKGLAGSTLALWVGVIVAGRLIAYVEAL
ncbi:MAG: DUF6644 family protein [Polyangiales bacterium]